MQKQHCAWHMPDSLPTQRFGESSIARLSKSIVTRTSHTSGMQLTDHSIEDVLDWKRAPCVGECSVERADGRVCGRARASEEADCMLQAQCQEDRLSTVSIEAASCVDACGAYLFVLGHFRGNSCSQHGPVVPTSAPGYVFVHAVSNLQVTIRRV